MRSNDPQVVIRTARKSHSCDCHYPPHAHAGRPYDDNPGRGRWCTNVIAPGDQYPEYLGESAGYQSGHRYCPDCRADQLGAMLAD